MRNEDTVSRQPDGSRHRAKQARGSMAYHAGAAAEQRVAQDYERRGFRIDRLRWRGKGGEIDLIVRDGDGLIFVEVKKSASFARAAQHISTRQIARIYTSAEEYLGTQPNGSLTEVRFDVALIDSVGAIRIIENAFGHG
jgi:putative endonuclease